MAVIEGYGFPDDAYFHPEHAWARMGDKGVVTIGMNDFFTKEAGDVVHVDLPFEGDEVVQGEVCGKLQSSKWIGKLVSPLSGAIVEVNTELESDSTWINKSPYHDGWIIRVQPSDWENEKGNLLYGPEQIQPWLEKEIARMKAERK